MLGGFQGHRLNWSIPDLQSRTVHAGAGYNVVQCGVVQCGVVPCDNEVQWGNGGDRCWVGVRDTGSAGPFLTYRVGLYMLALVTMWYNVVWYNVVWYNVVWYNGGMEGADGGLVSGSQVQLFHP